MDNFMGELKDVKVGDKLYTKTYDHWDCVPHYHIVEVKKVTPTGKLRLDSGTLIDPTRTHLKPYTKEIELERVEWNIKHVLIRLFTAMEGGTSKVFNQMPIENVEAVIDNLMPLLEALKGYKEYNASLTNDYTERLPQQYRDLLKLKLKIKSEIEGEK